MRFYFLFIFSIISFFLTAQEKEKNILIRCNEKLVNIVIEDIFSPPVSSRVFVYPNIAAYEILALSDTSLGPLGHSLQGYSSIPAPTTSIDYSFAAFKAFCLVGKKLIYSEHLMTNFENEEIKKWKSKNKDTLLLDNSIKYATIVANHIIHYLNNDSYNYTRTLMRYELVNDPSAWRPTPPEYMNALEPNWRYMRSFLFDSTNEIKVIPNIEFSENKNSIYYKNALSLYDTCRKLNTQKKEIATFWDDNPNTSISNGHMTYFIHKASPAGHWIRITGQALQHHKTDLSITAKIYTYLTLGIYEGFLNCWKEKYASNSVRPETYIQRLINPNWKPLIESPPFPEYTSGHSVVSSVSATILTYFFAKNYSYTDSSEMDYGIKPRKFKSFQQAAQEASISRFYGGIHYMPSLINGNIEGKEIGQTLIEILNKKQ